MTRDPRQLALFACFWLSGFAALLFQVVWTREFAFVFGTSELAIATVLAGFMGGLTGGAALAGRFAARIRRPILLYAILEGAIAISALVVPYAIEASTAIVVTLFGDQPELPSAGGLATGSFYVVSSLVILFVPTACMGATLPVLTRFAVERDDEIAERVGTLYAINTAGSVVGALVAAFWLLPTLGLRGSVIAGACVNLVIFAVGVALARKSPGAGTPNEDPPPAASATGSQLILVLLAISGTVSFSYEILWARLLSHVFGGSVQSFATMLASFLAGIAIGSSIASRFARTPRQAARGFVVAQLGIAGFSTLCFAFADSIPGLAVALGANRETPLAQAALGLAVLLPAAICIGATLPFAVGVLARSAEGAAAATARCYAWNTLGAIVGSLATGFILLPELGFHGLLLLAVAINLGLAAAATRLAELGEGGEGNVEADRLRPVAIAIAAILACAVFVPAPERLITTSPFQLSAPQPELLHELVGRSASVTAVLTPDGELEIRTNGLKEASIRRPGAPNPLAYAWLPGLAAALRPEARDLLVVGFGGGELLESVPKLFSRIDVVEIEEEILEANRRVAHLRAADPFADPRLRIATNDVRGALVLTQRTFDAIVSQPSHPWTEGASHLYTREFFALASEHLNPGGILVQWVGIDFLDEVLFRSTLAALRSVFRHVEVYLPYPYSEAYFAASDAPIDWKASGDSFVRSYPEDALRLGIFGAEDLLVALRLDDNATQRVAEGAEPITDARNAYQFRKGRKPDEVRALFNANDPIPAALSDGLDGLDAAYLKRRLGPRGSAIVDAVAAPPLPSVVRTAQQLAAKRKWDELESIDARLASIAPRNPHYPIAVQARVSWRLETGDVARAREAVALLDPLLLLVNSFEAYLWRARAFAAAGSTPELVGALRNLSGQLERRRATLSEENATRLKSMGRDLLPFIPEEGPYAADRAWISLRLQP